VLSAILKLPNFAKSDSLGAQILYDFKPLRKFDNYFKYIALTVRAGFSGSRPHFVAGANGIKSVFGFGVHVGGDDLSDKDYVVAGDRFRYKRALEIGYGIGQQDRINGFGGFGLTVDLAMLRIEFDEFVHLPAGA
jgi:hypothetical protein